MRLGRIILLASLAQLLGLTTLAAALSEHPAFTNDAQHADETAAWQALAPVINADVTLDLGRVRASYQTVYAITALAETPFKHSVWMVSPAVRTVAIPRPRRYTLLRC